MFKTKYWYWIWRTFLGPSRLRKKFTRTFLFATLIPLILMGLGSYYLANRIHTFDVAIIERTVATQTSGLILKSINEVLENLKIEVAYTAFAPIKFTEQEFILQVLLTKHRVLSSLSFLCTTPDFCLSGSETSKLTEFNQSGPITYENYADSREFMAAKEGDFYIGGLTINGAKPTLILAAPVLNKNRQIVGVLRGELSLASIQATITETKIGETGYVYLADPKGTIIAHPNRALIGGDASSLPHIQAAINPSKIGIGKNSNALYTFISSAGEMVSGTGTTLPQLGWILSTEWPKSETNRATAIIIYQIIGFTLIALIFIIILSARTAFKLITPIAYLAQGATIIGSGNFNYKTNIQTGDELEDLANNLNKMAGNLKALEELRSIELQSKYLAETLNKEKELSKIKDQFITTMSHQINTPLTVINWTIEEISKPDTSAEVIRDGLARIAESRRDILTIASDLITLSEIGFNYRVTRVEAIDLGKLTLTILSNFHPLLEAKQIQILGPKITNDVTVNGSLFATKKIIENLIDNAVSYSNKGSPIDIEIMGRDSDVLFTIRDYGIGIPKADYGSIFQEFFRASNAMQKKHVGTGLGLFLIKTMIEKGYGGKIWFESEEGKGTKFLITLPRQPIKIEEKVIAEPQKLSELSKLTPVLKPAETIVLSTPPAK